jgi:hypothetical protein
MQIHLHQTHHTLADFSTIFQTLKSSIKRPGIHLYPELFLTGYPLADLCLSAPFIQRYHLFLEEINAWAICFWRRSMPGPVHFQSKTIMFVCSAASPMT